MSDQYYNQNDQNDQSSWVASGGPETGVGREAPWQQQQQPQGGYEQPGIEIPQGQQPLGNAGGGGGLLGGPLNGVRQAVENQIYQAIDHYGSQVPGGHQFTPEAKNAVAGILDNLQRQLEAQAANRMGGLGGLGGLGGSLFGEGGNQGSNQSGQGGQGQL